MLHVRIRSSFNTHTWSKGDCPQQRVLVYPANSTAVSHLRHCIEKLHQFVVPTSGWLQVYVAWLDGGTAVFAFRGTESVKDALADLNAVPIDIDWMTDAFPEVRGHSGMLRCVMLCCALGASTALPSSFPRLACGPWPRFSVLVFFHICIVPPPL